MPSDISISKTPTSEILRLNRDQAADSGDLSGIFQFDPSQDLPAHYGADGDSFYIVSYVKSGSHEFTVLFHLMLVDKAPGPSFAQLAISVLDENHHYYFSREMNWPLQLSFVQRNDIGNPAAFEVITSFEVKTPNGSLAGTMDELRVEAHDDTGEIGIAFTMRAFGPVLANLATGIIPFAGGVDYEYALPRIKTRGTLTIGEQIYEIDEGWSWLDREWGHFGPSKWTWFAIQLDDLRMSLWSQMNHDNPEKFLGVTSFVTILNPDGSFTVASAEVEEESHWRSKVTGVKYPTRWRVKIPARQIDLGIALLRDDQEIVSRPPLPPFDNLPAPGTNRLEGKARVEGALEGRSMREGAAFVELFNLFPVFANAYRPGP